jgi:hypothetical protein
MAGEYIAPGTSSKQINENIENDPNTKEGNEDYFACSQNLYTEERCKYRVHKTI